MKATAIISTTLSATAIALIASPAFADFEIDFSQDASLHLERVLGTDGYFLPTGAYDGEKVPGLRTEGYVVQQVWRTSGTDTATLGLLTPLRQQIAVGGFDILFECDTRECGGFDFRFNTEVVEEPDMHVDLGDYRFLAAKRMVDGAAEFVSLLVSRSPEHGFVQLVSVGQAPAEDAVSAISTKSSGDALAQGDLSVVDRLELDGVAVLEGIRFKTGATSLEDGSTTPLTGLADFLNRDVSRKVVLVGHTDAQGSLEGNIALSRKRAEAVLGALVENYGVARDQLHAEGVGYLSPRASNATDTGRAKNRRVEVVLTPTL